ncbi:MAG TPA: hypothetical protein VFV34_09470 [Blastocatellia bacterium]|nr:hypothetical protein [Blastocatellia bacterium]
MLGLFVFAALIATQNARAFQTVSWTDTEGTFVLDTSNATWSCGTMSGGVNSLEDVNGAIYFEGSGDAGVYGYVFGNQGTAFVQSNTGTMVVSGPIN